VRAGRGKRAGCVARIGLDKRIGSKFLHAGPGYGGSCFPKDTLALVKTGQDYSAPQRIVETAVSINDLRKHAMARKIIAACGGSVRGKTIALLGLTFKPNTDDMREAPALSIAAALQDAGAEVRGYDPQGMEMARPLMPSLAFVDNAYDCLAGADAVAIVTEWDEFRALDLARVKHLLKTPIFIDLRNVYPPEDVKRQGSATPASGDRMRRFRLKRRRSVAGNTVQRPAVPARPLRACGQHKGRSQCISKSACWSPAAQAFLARICVNACWSKARK